MHGLLQINTPIGAPATMVLRGKDDKHCDTIWFANLGGGGCGGGAPAQNSAPGLVLLDGSAGEDAASAEIGTATARPMRLTCSRAVSSSR